MKACIQSELVGDEDDVVIDYAILECLLQEAIFDALMKNDKRTFDMELIDGVVYAVLSPYCVRVPMIDIDFTFER